MTAHTRLPQPLVESIRKALTRNALPGETQGLSPEAEREAAEFLAQVAARRRRGELGLKIESIGGEAGKRRMRIGIVNDDMPFLVDSVANAIAARQLTIHRLLHRSCAWAATRVALSGRSRRCATTRVAANP
jgi:glutamate dehydrogenase